MVWELDIEIVYDEKHKPLLRQAYAYGFENAKDDSTRNGALLLDRKGKIISFGCSGLPKEIQDLPHRRTAPTKYSYVKHAETDAIFRAARKGSPTEGAILYCPWYACSHCAIAIVSAGIESVIGHEEVMQNSPERWQQEIIIGLEILREADVKTFLYSGKIDQVQSLTDGKMWCP
jgi:dCMP deaminase